MITDRRRRRTEIYKTTLTEEKEALTDIWDSERPGSRRKGMRKLGTLKVGFKKRSMARKLQTEA